MRLTFILDEQHGHTVSVNGEGYQIETVPSSVPVKVYAVQVYTTYTEVENLDMTNDVFADPPSYVHDLVQAWQEAKEAHEAEQAASELINVNTAALEELVSLSGISEVRAQAIIDGRPWADVSELSSISGISAEMVDEWNVTV